MYSSVSLCILFQSTFLLYILQYLMKWMFEMPTCSNLPLTCWLLKAGRGITTGLVPAVYRVSIICFHDNPTLTTEIWMTHKSTREVFYKNNSVLTKTWMQNDSLFNSIFAFIGITLSQVFLLVINTMLNTKNYVCLSLLHCTLLTNF